MTRRKIIMVLMSSVTLILGCATTQISVYQSWGEQLLSAAQSGKTVSDVSLLLGVEPYKCEDIESKPVIGILIEDGEGIVVVSVDPDGSAAAAGILHGDKILSVNGKKTFKILDFVSLVGSETALGKLLVIETSRITVTLQARYPSNTAQCYWEVRAGEIQRNSGGAYVDKYRGSASHSGVSYNRYFRASCRFIDGRVVVCQSHWQE